jgi:hypothetical protein
MLRFNILIVLIVIFIMASCGKSKNEINPLILGNWQLIEIYGVKADNSINFFFELQSAKGKIHKDQIGIIKTASNT